MDLEKLKSELRRELCDDFRQIIREELARALGNGNF